ncbi:MAG: HDOD domain-containing protein [Rhodocyclaceae bacterium]|nr:HDOD domain-containing protein [Rhodocyclaceae bacterium]
MKPTAPPIVENLASASVRIPTQPAVLVELFELLESGDFDIRRVARVMARDAGLTAMLFKLAATPAYAKGRPLQNLEQVLQVVGVRQSFNLARALALRSAIGGERHLMEAFWERSNAIAGYAATIAADRVMVCNLFPDLAYMAGMFQDCGVPLMAERFDRYATLEALAVRPPKPVCMIEEDRKFSTDHCTVGYLVARHWRLPDFVAEAIRHHHELSDLGEHSVRSLIAILQLATEMHHRDLRIQCDEWLLNRDAVAEELGLDVEGLDEFCEEMRDRCQSGH